MKAMMRKAFMKDKNLEDTRESPSSTFAVGFGAMSAIRDRGTWSKERLAHHTTMVFLRISGTTGIFIEQPRQGAWLPVEGLDRQQDEDNAAYLTQALRLGQEHEAFGLVLGHGGTLGRRVHTTSEQTRNPNLWRVSEAPIGWTSEDVVRFLQVNGWLQAEVRNPPQSGKGLDLAAISATAGDCFVLEHADYKLCLEKYVQAKGSIKTEPIKDLGGASRGMRASPRRRRTVRTSMGKA